MKKAKRLLAAALVLVLTLSGLPLSAFAADSVTLTGDYYDVDESGNVVPGTGTDEPEQTITDGSGAYVKMSKTAAETGNDNEFTITLNVETMEDLQATAVPTGANVVLVFDVTVMMDKSIYLKENGNPISPGESTWKLEDSRWSLLKEAAKEFIEKFLVEGSNNHVSIVIYGGQAYLATGTPPNIHFLKDGWSAHPVPGFEEYGYQMLVHKTICEWTSDAAEAISSFYYYDTTSNGAANALRSLGLTPSEPILNVLVNDHFTFASDGAFGYSTNCQAGFWAALKQLSPIYNEADPNYLNDSTLSQNAPHLIFMAADGAGDSYETRQYEEYNSYKNNSDAAKTAGQLKDEIDNLKIYTVGMSVEALNGGALDPEFNKAVDDHYSALDGEAVSIAYNTILSQIYTASDAWIVTDPLPDYVNFDSVSGHPEDDCYEFENRTLVWDLTKCTPTVTIAGGKTVYNYTLSYTITIDPTDLEPGEVYPTNKQTTLTYAFADPDTGALGDTQTENFLVPTVKVREEYAVSYTVTGEAPATSSTIPSTVNYYEGDEVTVAPDLTTTCTTNSEGKTGTWEFNGWETDDAMVIDGEFDMPAKAVVLAGTWTFTEAGKYNVSYAVTGDAPSSYSAMPTTASYYAGDEVTVAANLTTSETTHNGQTGTWTFNGWTTSDATVSGSKFDMPAKAVVLTGTWTFTEADKYPVSYTVTGDAPSSYSAIPATASYYAGEEVTVAGNLTTSVTTHNGQTGTWTFNGWTTSDATVSGSKFDMPAKAVVLTGTWTFTEADKYPVSYTVTGDAPSSYSAIPATASYYAGEEVIVAAGLTTSVTTHNGKTGTWTFNSWETDDATVSGGKFDMPANAVELTGSWTFTEADKYPVSYTVTGDAPSSYSAIPTTASYYAGEEVIVAANLTTSETTHNGQTGTWTFNGWSTTDATVSGGKFNMPENAVVLTGTWTFTEATKYDVSYTVTGDAPSSYSAMPTSASYYAGDEVTVAAGLTTSVTTHNGKTGTWTFSGWATSDATVSGGKFDMPANAVVLTGSWTFTEANKYDVSYTVTGDAPSSYSTIPATVSYYAGEEVTVAGGLTTSVTTHNGKTGTWTFNSWETDDATVSGGKFDMPAKAVELTGTWTFTETDKYSVSYKVMGDAPSSYSAIPATVSYYAGEEVTVAGGLTTSVITHNGKTGTWTFNGWTTSDATVSGGKFDMPGNAVELTGTWTFTETTKYDVSYTVTGDAPSSYSAIPTTASYYAGEEVTVAANLTTSETTYNGQTGTWTFNGWSTTDATVSGGKFDMPANAVVLTGTWTFTEADKYNVSYTVTGDAPASSSAMPTTASYYAGDEVTVAANLTTSETMHNGQTGVWSFNGWTTSDATVSGGKFNMPANAVVLTGTWTFTEADMYPVSYTVTGDAPSSYSAMPATASYYAGDEVTVAANLTTSETTHNGQTGTWMFNGWTTTDATVSGGKFDMPANAVVLTGTWTFTEADKYSVSYKVMGDAPSSYSSIPATASYYAGEEVIVAAGLTTSVTTHNGKTGTWTFNGWTTSDATVSGGKFDMPANAVELTGTWTFTEATKYDVSYTVTGDAPSSYSAIPTTASYYAGEEVTVAANLTTSETTYNGQTGTWTFNGWSTTDATVSGGKFDMPTKAVVLTGSWTFTPNTPIPSTYNAGYQFVSGTSGKSLPSVVMALLPSDTTDYMDGATVSAIDPAQLTVTASGGTWTFDGWDEDEKTIDGDDVIFIGTWMFTPSQITPSTYNAGYTFVSGTPGKALPSAVMALLPGDSTSYEDGAIVTALPPAQTTVSASGGTWTFRGWDANSKTINGDDVIFVGTWTFTPSQITPSAYNAGYQFVSGTSGKALPASVMALLPGDSNNYEDGAIVTALTPAQTTVSASGGTWTFQGWDANSKTINGDDVIFIGTWTFTPSQTTAPTYNAGYQFVSGTSGKALPASVMALLPGDSNNYEDGAIVTALTPAQTTVSASGGTWTFQGWDADSKTIYGDDVIFTGVWTLTPDEITPLTYNAGYQFVSGTSGKALPASVMALLPGDNANYEDGAIVTALTPAQTTVSASGGTWTFQGWDADSKTIYGDDVIFIGTWTFTPNQTVTPTYNAGYQFVSGTSGKALPASVMALLPGDSNNYEDGAIVIALAPTQSTVSASGGTWTFRGWDADSKTIYGDDVIFIGTWTFTPSQTTTPTYNAGYTFISGTTGKTLPAAVWAYLPSDTADYEDGTPVTALTPAQITVTASGGTWRFQGWDADSKTINGDDVIFVGTWTFTATMTPSTYNAGYQFVSGTSGKTLPAAVWAYLPSDTADYEDGTTVTAINPAQTTVTVSDGTWTFQGWDANRKTIDGDDVIFIGTWTFTPYTPPPSTYTVEYRPNGGTGSHTDSGLSYGSRYTVHTLYETGIYRGGYTFIGWNTRPDGTGRSYAAGDIITITGNVTLYAQWRYDGWPEPTPPPVTPPTTSGGGIIVVPPASIPQTGDDSNLALWIAVMGAGIIMLAIVALTWPKKKHNTK